MTSIRNPNTIASVNLRTLDLNLLLIFDAIYGERSISRAALKLHLSQPTVSNALARLRERLQDPLFERSAGGMLPTARARTLADPIRQALTTLERGLRGDDRFDFARAEREFVIAVEDYGESVILPGFIQWLAEVAPGVRIRIRAETSAPIKGELRDGTVDLALDYFPLLEARYHHHCMLTESLMCLSRRDHPALNERMTLETYLSMRHIVLGTPSNSRPMIDLALSKRGLRRQIAVTVPHFISMPVMVQSTDMVCTLPRRMARLYADNFRLESHVLPLRLPQFPVYLIWHEAQAADAGHQWLRSHLTEFCQRLRHRPSLRAAPGRDPLQPVASDWRAALAGN
jgi:DNA-binding transcriptional LysR family regulator